MINLDYLICNIEISREYIHCMDCISSKRFSFQELQYGTKNFKNSALIWMDGKEFGSIFWNPYEGSVLDCCFAQFQLKNNQMYEGLQHVKVSLLEFFSDYRLTWSGWNRIDLALDGNLDYNGVFGDGLLPNNVSNLSKMVFSEKVKFTGREKAFTAYTTTTGRNTGWSFGLKSSDRFLRFYNKSDEMRKKANKPYICDYWRHFLGLDMEQDVYRFEIQLNRRFVRSILKFEDLFEMSYLGILFKTALEKWFDPRINSGAARITDMKKMELVKWCVYDLWITGYKESNEFIKIKRVENETDTNSVLQNKILLKKMFFRYLHDSQENVHALVFIGEIFQKAYGFDYNGFFWQKMNLWVEDFRKKHNKLLVFDRVSFSSGIRFVSDLDY